MNWTPLHVQSHYSLRKALSKPVQIAKRCKELGYTTCALTDQGSLSGSVGFMAACKKYEVKPIIGCKFYITREDASVKTTENRILGTIIVLAKNLQGWKNLLKATAFSNTEERVYYNKPRLSLEELAGFAGNDWFVLTGHLGSSLCNSMLENQAVAYNANSVETAKQGFYADTRERADRLIGQHQELFGKENLFLELQLIDTVNFPLASVLANIFKTTGYACLASADCRYPSQQDAVDHRLLVCSGLETTLNAVQAKLVKQGEDTGLGCFFRSNKYHILSPAELQSVYTDTEIGIANEIGEACETYNIFNKPFVPSFTCPNGLTSHEYLTELCRKGWAKKIANKIPKDKIQIYIDRMTHELEVIKKAKILSDYFLIVTDYMQWARQRMLCGKGRGSGSGSLVSHLLDITDIDPIEHNLLFERFFNAGRFVPEYITFSEFPFDKFGV